HRCPRMRSGMNGSGARGPSAGERGARVSSFRLDPLTEPLFKMDAEFDTLVITVTRNKLSVARQTIPHLKQRTARPFHYAVVANGDLDSGKWLLDNRDRGWFDSLAVLSDNLGVGAGYNLFWRHFIRFNKTLAYVVKFDDSNVPTRPDWLDELIRL